MTCKCLVTRICMPARAVHIVQSCRVFSSIDCALIRSVGIARRRHYARNGQSIIGLTQINFRKVSSLKNHVKPISSAQRRFKAIYRRDDAKFRTFNYSATFSHHIVAIIHGPPWIRVEARFLRIYGRFPCALNISLVYNFVPIQ